MLIFFPLLRRLSLTEALVPSPMVTAHSVKGAFLFPASFVVQSDIEEHLRIGPGSMDRETPTSGGFIDFQLGG